AREPAAFPPPRRESFRWPGCALGDGDRVDLLRMKDSASICQAGQDVVLSHTRIVLKYVGGSPTLGKEVYDKLHRQACSFDHGFPAKDLRVNNDPPLPVHGCQPPF